MVKIYTLQVESLDLYDQEFEISLLDNNGTVLESYLADCTEVVFTLADFQQDHPDKILTLEIIPYSDTHDVREAYF